MSGKKKLHEYSYSHQYEWLLNLLGKGRTRYCLLGFMFLTMVNLFLMLPALMFDAVSTAIIQIIVILGSVSLFLNLLITMRLRYWRDVIVWGFGILIPATTQFLIIGFMLIFQSGQFSVLFLALVGILASMFFGFSRSKQAAKRWELARRQGFLKNCLDEEQWLYDNDPAKISRAWLDFASYEKTAGKYKNSLKWLRRLENLHYLIP